MSYGEKIKYGGAPPAFNPKCAEDLSLMAAAINDLYQQVYISGGGYVPTSTEAATIPPTHPARNRVRFKLTEAIGATTTKEGAAVAVDGDGSDIAGAPAFNVVDSLNRYPAAGSGKYGWAEYLQYPDDTYRLEIVSLGGEGTVVGSGGDELVKNTSNDTAAGYLFDKIDTWSGAPTYDSGIHQPVWCDEQNDGGSETSRFFTSKQSAVETYTVKVSAADTTESYLFPAITAAHQETAAFNATDHQRVYFRIDSAGGNETLGVYLKRSEDTGKVKTSGVDTLDYLYDQFQDKGTYDSDRHQIAYCDNTGEPRSAIRIYTNMPLCAKITVGINARTGDAYGSGTADLGYTVSGVWTSVLEDETVYNPGASAIHIPSALTSIHMPVLRVKNEWILVNPFDPYQLGGFVYDNDQSIGHDESDEPEWQDDGACA